jgi:hypothetical protein
VSVSNVKVSSAGVGGQGKGTDAGSATLSYRAEWRVTCDSQADTAQQVLEHFRLTADLPWFGRVFKVANGFDVDAICTDLNCDPVAPGFFNVRGVFDPVSGGGGQARGTSPEGKETTNPLEWYHDIDVSYTQISIPVERALFMGFDPPGIENPRLVPGVDYAIVNSAIVPLDPTLETDLDITVVRISSYRLLYDDDQTKQYRGAINKDPLVISKPDHFFKITAPQYAAKIKTFGATFSVVNGVPLYRTSIEVHINPLTWIRQVVDRGLLQSVEPGDPKPDGTTYSNSDLPSPARKQITDDEGYPISEPVLLNGRGKPLGSDGTGEEKPVFLKWATNPIVSFTPIIW